MKIKELQKTVNVAWSPAQQNPILLAAGTAAQQLDAASANSLLEIYSANLGDPSYDLELKGCQASPHRFQKIVWSPTGFNGSHPNGLIVGGCEGGHLQIYSASKLLNGEESLIAHQNKHTGAIRGLDFNPFQHNLLASVASESEIFIWDLNNTTTPMAPGTKSQPLEDIQNVAWNKQVQHILSSVFSSKCVIWDLRKNEQIIKLSDTQSRVRWRAIQWHPDIATQLWLASEEDQAPFIQLWDLRYATAPAKTIQVHQRGILGLTWCPKDSDLMVSCGKDNKIYCWNPNSEFQDGEILSEVATTIQWYSDVQWCPRNPALIAGSTFEGNVSIYSMFGGSQQQVQTSNKIADSFPGMDQFAQAPIPQPTTQLHYSDLKRAPKWMKRPTGVSFGFGGKLATFNQNNPRNVNINQIVTEPELVQRSAMLEKTLEEGNFINYCKKKADEVTDQHGRYIWYFLKANFESDPKAEMLNLLGYNKDDIKNKFNKYLKDEDLQNQNSVEQVQNKLSTLTHSDSSEVEGDQSTDDSTDLSGGDNNALFEAIAAGNKALTEVKEKNNMKFKIPVGEGNDALICEAILSGNIEAAVEICMEAKRPAEALIIASTAGPDFLSRIQNRYLNKTEGELAQVISALVSQNWVDMVMRCAIDSWKEVLVAALTHHSGEQSSLLCARLGERLQEESTDPLVIRNALLCYICAGDLEKLVDVWIGLKNFGKDQNVQLNTNDLLELVEIVMLLKKALELRGQIIEPSGKLAEFLSQYAGLLATQGALESAFSYLSPSIDEHLVELRERLYYALGHKRQLSYSRGSIPHQQQQTNIYKPQVQKIRFTQQRSSFSNVSQPSPPISSSYNTGLPGMYPPAPVQTQAWNAQPVVQSQVPPLNPVPLLPPNQPIQAKPSIDVPTLNEGLGQPQRPSSVGSQGSTPLSRAKYVLDPSVASSPSYGQNAAYSTQLPNSTPHGFNTPYNQYNTTPFNSSVSSSAYQSTQNTAPPAPLQSNFKPFTPAQPFLSGATNQGSYLPGITPIETAQTTMPPPPPSHKNPTPPPGWNDPPALKSTRSQVKYNDQNEMSAKHAGTRKWGKIINANTNAQTLRNQRNLSSSSEGNFMFQPPKIEQSAINPITHPLHDPNQNQNGYSDSNMGYANTQYPGPQPSISNQQHMLYPQQTIPHDNQYANQMNFSNPPMSQMYKPYHETPAPSKAELPKEKPPLPEEFVYLQTVLEELKNQCLNVAPDPRTKRKFVDVGKRLESLYDALRERKLAPNTVSALNDIVQYIQNGEYPNALATHTVIVSGPDFAQTATFMPGIKVLVQSASELKVYLR